MLFALVAFSKVTCAREVTRRLAAREVVARRPSTSSGRPSFKLELM